MSKKFFNNTWESVEILGKGSFGTVYKAKKIDDEIELYSAIKEISIPNNIEDISSLKTEGMTLANIDEELESHVNSIKKEIKTLYKFKDSTNIVNIEDYEVKEINTDNEYCSKTYKIYIRMELLKSIDDLFLSEDLKDKEVLKLGIDIATALEELESEKFIHRDIKPENIFVNKRGVYKLGDFGEARELSKTISNVSVKGTEHYMAPELLGAKKIDKTVDIYSLGIVLYRFFNNKKFPFYPVDGSNLTVKIREEARLKRYSGEELPKPVSANDEIANIILKMCAFNKEDRYQNATELKIDLENALANIKKASNIFEDISEEKIEEYNKTVHLSDIDDEDKTISLYGKKNKIINDSKEKSFSNIEKEAESVVTSEEPIENETIFKEENKKEEIKKEKNINDKFNIKNKKEIIILLIIIVLSMLFLGNMYKNTRSITDGFVETTATGIASLSENKTILLLVCDGYCATYENMAEKIHQDYKYFALYYLDFSKIRDYYTGNIIDEKAYNIYDDLEECDGTNRDDKDNFDEEVGNFPLLFLIKDNTIYNHLFYIDKLSTYALEDYIKEAIPKIKKNKPTCAL